LVEVVTVDGLSAEFGLRMFCTSMWKDSNARFSKVRGVLSNGTRRLFVEVHCKWDWNDMAVDWEVLLLPNSRYDLYYSNGTMAYFARSRPTVYFHKTFYLVALAQ